MGQRPKRSGRFVLVATHTVARRAQRVLHNRIRCRLESKCVRLAFSGAVNLGPRNWCLLDGGVLHVHLHGGVSASSQARAPAAAPSKSAAACLRGIAAAPAAFPRIIAAAAAFALSAAAFARVATARVATARVASVAPTALVVFE